MVSVPDCLARISDFLQLLSQLDTTGPPPTSKTAIEALPTVVIDQSEVDSGRDCSVCMELFKKSDSAKKLPCQHFFHIPCIDPWLALHNTCPICRKVVETTAPSCGQSTSTGPATSSTNADTSRSSPSTPANSLSC